MNVLSDLEIFFREVTNCPYYNSLSSRPLELQYKYPPSSCPWKEIKRGTRTLSKDELFYAFHLISDHIQPKLFSWLPEIQPTPFPINILWVTSGEMEGGASWTSGNTIFLTNWGVLSHELCHLYQRNVPCIFDSLYHQWGFTPIERETILLLISNHNSEYIDNPDISSQYFTYQGVILPIYTHSMGKTLLRIDEEKQYSTFSKPLKIPFLHPSFLWQLNHPHEMFAEIFESFFRKLNK